ncbi:hypothetical protein [Variimorphobacter saccharofermentans]|nr:hypothetical protein [Variimorphobacter saccharofermentans]
MFIAQVALRFIPNVELISLFIILFTLILGWKTLYIIYVFVAIEALIYGFGLWVINYLYIWAFLFFITMLFKKYQSKLFMAVISGIFGFTFGALCSIPYFITGGAASGIAYWIAGLRFDIIHGISNFIIAFILYKPFYSIIEQASKRLYTQS